MPREIKRISVKSANLRTIGYDEKNQLLQVEFESGSVWNYTPFSASEHDALMAASSIGGHFAKHVRDCKISEKVSFVKREDGPLPVSLVRQRSEKPSTAELISQSSRIHEIIRKERVN